MPVGSSPSSSGSGGAAIADSFLRYGDYLTLKSLRWQSYLSGEGVLNNDVFMNDSLAAFEDHVFQVVIQRQYSAKNEYEDYIEKQAAGTEERDESGDSSKHLEALMRGKLNEVVMNETLMRHKVGYVVRFGDIVQLLHVKSKKFLHVPGSDLARDERENMRLVLNSDGGQNSWINILPRFKIDKEGDRVTNNTECILRITERPQEHLHCSDRNPVGLTRFREVNVSPESVTSWRLTIYRSTQFPVPPSTLAMGELVYIRDPETASNLQTFEEDLALEKVSIMSEIEDVKECVGSESEKDEDDEDGTGEDGEDNSISSAQEFEMEYGTVALKPSLDTSQDSNAIWVMESSSIVRAGTLQWRSDVVFFRHFNTGKYLCSYDSSKFILGQEIREEEDEEEQWDNCLFRTTSRRNPKRAAFSLVSLHASGDTLETSGAIHLKQGEVYLERSAVYNDRWQTYACSGTRNRMKAVGLIINKYTEVVREMNPTKGKKLDAACALDIQFASVAQQMFKRYMELMVMPSPKETKVATVWPTLDPAERAYFGVSADKITHFVKGYPILLTSAQEMDNYKPVPLVCRKRQDMLREQRSLEAIIRILAILIPVADRLTTMEAAQAQFNPGGLLSTAKATVFSCVKVLYEACRNNKENQKYVAEFMPIVLCHCGTEPLAAKITQELLSTNRELQETKITAKDINIFSTKIKESGMTTMFLRLLQSCCSNNGEGIPRNQNNVQQILFDKHHDALIRIMVDADGYAGMSIEWNVDTSTQSLFTPASMEGKDVMGSNLYTDGLPGISLTWECKSAELTPQALFSKSVVKLYDIFKADSECFVMSRAVSSNFASRISMRGSNVPQGQSKDETKRRALIGEFLVAQLNLAANMCLGRNYPVIAKLEELFPFAMLVALIKDISSPPSLQGAATMLLTNLYIDREPQLAASLPRLTRTLTETSNSDSSTIYSISDDKIHLFLIPQLLIATHIKGLKNRPFTHATNSILLMLHKLVGFGFYGTREKLQDVIEPLLAALKRDEIEDDEAISTKSPQLIKRGLSFKGGNEASAIAKLKTQGNRSDEEISPLKKIGVEGEEGDLLLDAGFELVKVKKATSFESSDGSEEKGEHGKDRIWQERLLDTMQSSSWVIFILLIVIVAVAEAVWAYITGITNTATTSFEYVVFCIFALEVSTRAYCFKVVNGNIIQFVLDIFNIVDMTVVVLDIVIFIGTADAAPKSGGYGNVFRVIRVLRALRFARVLKAIFMYRLARIANAISLSLSMNEIVKVEYVEPERYYKTSDANLQNLVEIVRTLELIQSLVEDRNVSILLHGFYGWYQGYLKDPENKERLVETAASIALEEEEQMNFLSVSSPDYDDLYIDLLMYSNPTLVQCALNVLMAHHCNKRAVLENASRIQLLSNSRREQHFARLDYLVKVLNTYADTFEVWSSLKKEEHRKINSVVHASFIEIATGCYRRREVLKSGEDYEPDVMIQHILRNLGAYELCIKSMRLINSIDVNNTISLIHQNTRQIVLEASRVIYWMTLGNAKNQSVAYQHLDFFIKLIDEKVETHRIVTAMFKDNAFLSSSVPKLYISDFINRIINVGRFPHYLAFLAAVAVAGDKNIIENQYEIIRLISAPYNQKKCVLYFVPSSHPSYAKKLKDMAPFKDKLNLQTSDLSSDLAYHLDLIQLLGLCTVGKYEMTTIEAKVQSMYSFVDLVESMLDPNCLLLGKIRYGQFLYNAMLEVEMRLPSLKDAKCIWDLLESMQDAVGFAKDEIRQIEKNGWGAPTSNKLRIEYMLVCASITAGYFEEYFDLSIFRPDVGQAGVERVQIREKKAYDVVTSLFYKFRGIYEMQTPLLTRAHQETIFHVLEVLNDVTPAKIVMTVENLHAGLDLDERASVLSAQEIALNAYMAILLKDERVMLSVEKETQDFIAKIDALPKQEEITDATVRFEPLLEKLVRHIQGTIQIVQHGGEVTKYICEQETKTNTWLIKIFRTMIENRWGMSIDDRDEDGGVEQDTAAGPIMATLNAAGCTEVCLMLIARGIDEHLQAEAIKLLVALLFKEGGAFDIQLSINNYLSRRGSDLFFAHMRSLLQNLISWHKWHGVVTLEKGEKPSEKLPEEIILIRMLQLTCEGHYLPNQDILREQPNNAVSINLLDDFVQYLAILDQFPCKTSTTAALAVTATVLEVIQGPCKKNQDHFAITSELLETLNRKLRQRPLNDCDPDDELELKRTLIDILQALLEGQGRRLAVYERVLSVIHLDVVKLLCKPDEDEEEVSDSRVALMTESLVLMQLLLDFKPSLVDELELKPGDLVSEHSNVECIEVVWNHELQRRFFPVPEICDYLAKSTKDDFVVNADRSSSEGKLFDLIATAGDMYTEILHFVFLKEHNLHVVFSRRAQEYVSWGSLIISCIINALFLSYYQNVVVDCHYPQPIYFNSTSPTSIPTSRPTSNPTSVPTSHPTSPSSQIKFTAVPTPSGGGGAGYLWSSCFLQILTSPTGADTPQVVLGLQILLCITALYSVVNCIVVRIPVIYINAFRKSENAWSASFTSACDFLTVYSVVYLVLAINSIWASNHHLQSLLLLDVVTKSRTTRDTLMAIWKPRFTILMAMILMLVICFIYAVFYFWNFQIYGQFKSAINAITLRNTFEEILRYGTPYGSMQNDSWNDDGVHSYRWFFDVTFFLMSFTLWSVIKGITIDTFVELRTELTLRLHDTTEKCFVCGIERPIFNKALDRDAFDHHVKIEQNLWNYIYYCIFIWEQDKDDDDGLEYYIRHCIARGDLSWFPMNKAIRLTEHLEKGEVNSLQYLFRQDLGKMEKNFENEVMAFKDDVARFINKVESTLLYVEEGKSSEKEKKKKKRKESREGGNLDVSAAVTFEEDVDDGQVRHVSVAIRSLEDLVGRQDVIETPELLYVRILCDQGTYLQSSSPDAVFTRQEDKSSVVLSEDSQFYLVHSGSVISESGFLVRLQVVYSPNTGDGNHAPFKFLASCDVGVRDLVAAAAAGKAKSCLGPDEDGRGFLRVALLQRSLGGLPSSASTGPALTLLSKTYMVLEVRASARLILEYLSEVGDVNSLEFDSLGGDDSLDRADLNEDSLFEA